MHTVRDTIHTKGNTMKCAKTKRFEAASVVSGLGTAWASRPRADRIVVKSLIVFIMDCAVNGTTLTIDFHPLLSMNKGVFK